METRALIQSRTSIKRIIDLLKEEYGVPKWQLRDNPISVLVQTILSQNTSDTNSGAAFLSLLNALGSWENVASADVNTIESAIKHGGLGRIKAERIKQTLKEIERRRGRLELYFLNQLSLPEARDWLEQLPGVGEKTACCVLLFSLGMPALPVDTHILRVSKRLGLISFKTSLKQAHQSLGEQVPQQDVYRFHVLTIKHGRGVCRAQRPLCHHCVLKEICPGYKILYP